MLLFARLCRHRILRFLISGGMGVAINLALLYLFTDIFGWWYLLAATIAYPVAFTVGFILQKYWTFADKSSDQIHRQASTYILVTVINIFINNSILLTLVERYGFYHIVAQIFASLIVATWSFFIYRWLFQEGWHGESMKKIIYIANARIPTEKAHGGAIMKMCEAFANIGFDVDLIIPRRSNRNNEDPFGYYGVAMNFRIKKLLCLDLKKFDRARFLIQWMSFAKLAALYCFFNKAHWYYGRDELSLWFVSIFRNNTVWESHTAKDNMVVRGLLKRCRAVVLISNGLKDHYTSMGIPSEKILVAHSGVDLGKFENIKRTKKEIREQLSLPVGKKIVAYVGKRNTMGESKGVDDLEKMFKEIKNVNQEVYPLIVSDALPGLVPLYMKSADVLVMNYPDTEHYAHFMSPLKMFEYMASKCPIITTDLPAIREILDEESALLIPPADRMALSAGIERLLTDGGFAERLALNAYNKVQAYAWDKRARRIIDFLKP